MDLIKCNEPYDVLIGHSQGAILSSVILAQCLTCAKEDRYIHKPKAAILSGNAWPNPYTEMFNKLTRNSFSLSLHVIGENDNVNPPTDAQRLCDLFGGERLLHQCGHTLPMREQDINLYMKFLKKAKEIL